MIDLVRNNRERIACLCEQYNVKRLELFGSALSDDGFDPQTSDIDFLIEFLPLEPKQHAKCYFGLLAELQDMLSCNIDLIEIKAVENPYLLKSINESRRQIYAA